MTELGDLLKEAIFGDEPFDAGRGSAAVRQAIERFEARMRTVRLMGWTAVTLASAGAVAASAAFFRTERGDLRTLIAYAVLFVFAMTAVGFIKMWLFLMQNHLITQRELKRLRLDLHERTHPSAPAP